MSDELDLDFDLEGYLKGKLKVIEAIELESTDIKVGDTIIETKQVHDLPISTERLEQQVKDIRSGKKAKKKTKTIYKEIPKEIGLKRITGYRLRTYITDLYGAHGVKSGQTLDWLILKVIEGLVNNPNPEIHKDYLIKEIKKIN